MRCLHALALALLWASCCVPGEPRWALGRPIASSLDPPLWAPLAAQPLRQAPGRLEVPFPCRLPSPAAHSA